MNFPGLGKISNRATVLASRMASRGASARGSMEKVVPGGKKHIGGGRRLPAGGEIGLKAD